MGETEARAPIPKRAPIPRNDYVAKASIGSLCFRFFRYHWRGLVGLLTPIITIDYYYPAESNYDNVAMCAIIMIVYWVTECIPLQVTSFIPIALMPITRTMDTHPVCMCYFEDTVILYMAAIMLASAVQSSGLPRRIALKSFNYYGLTHTRMLFTVCFTTMFISMWITNTAATLVMMPIVSSLLEIYELQGQLKVYEEKENGVLVASQLTICYYCSVTFAATIGGIGTLFGTATNFVGKALFKNEYPEAPEYWSILKFSMFSIPIMLALNIFLYFYMAIIYLGMFRPGSKASKATTISEDAMQHSKRVIKRSLTEIGPMTCYEWFVIMIILFSIGVLCTRSPGYFIGWGDYLQTTLKLKGDLYILDSAAAIFICFILILLPCPKKCSKLFCKSNLEGPEDKPKDVLRDRRTGQQSRLLVTWDHMSGQLPWSYMFVLGAGMALATSCRHEYSNTNDIIVEKIKNSTLLDNLMDSQSRTTTLIPGVIILTVFVTNFVSNMIVAILGMIFLMNMAFYIHSNPLWYFIALQFSASFCFMLPLGAPGNYIVHEEAKVPIRGMMLAGLGPTIFSIILLWLAVVLYAPVIWPILYTEGLPVWVNRTSPIDDDAPVA